MSQALLVDQELPINILKLKEAAMVVRAINHPLRQQILKLLHEKGRLTVTEIYCHFRLEQSVTSAQLGILRRAGLVLTEKRTKHVFYSVNLQKLDYLQTTAARLIWDANPLKRTKNKGRSRGDDLTKVITE
jgi:DNA-binding transcriptional ArsR family regulator